MANTLMEECAQRHRPIPPLDSRPSDLPRATSASDDASSWIQVGAAKVVRESPGNAVDMIHDVTIAHAMCRRMQGKMDMQYARECNTLACFKAASVSLDGLAQRKGYANAQVA